MLFAIMAASALLIAQADQEADDLEHKLVVIDRASWTHQNDQEGQALVNLRSLLLQQCVVTTERSMLNRKGLVEDVAAVVMNACDPQNEDLITAMSFTAPFHGIEDKFDRDMALYKFRTDLRTGSISGVMQFLSRHRKN